MKKLISSAILAALSALPALAAMPIIIASPTLVFYSNGEKPVSYGGVKVLETVTVDLYSSTNQGMALNISGLTLNGDMLLITSKVNDASSSASFVFKQAGTYRAFIDRGGSNLISAGTFRILPAMAVDPAAPSTSDAVKITLTLGEIYPGDCIPVYSNLAKVTGSGIFLSFQELAVGSCMSPVDTMTFGPSFDLGKIAWGTYTVYIEDSVALGSIRVTTPMDINGMAHIMISKYVRMAPQPVSDAVITAVRYEPCIWYMLDGVALLNYSDTTNAYGMFSIKVPDRDWSYDVSSSMAGFHPQTIPVDMNGLFAYDPDTGSIPFQMIPSVVNPWTKLDIQVTENGAPLESAYVSLEPGRGASLCPMLVKASAVYPLYAGYGGYTDKAGKLVLDSISLNPYIDFSYGVSRYAVGKSLYNNGRIRLNIYDQDTLKINFGGTCLEASAPGAGSSLCAVAPNPFNPSTTLRVSKAGVRLAIYDIAGKLVKDFGAVRSRSVNWSPAGLANGIYLVKALDGKQTSVQKILFQK